MTSNELTLLGPGEVRQGRVALPPGFAVKAMSRDTGGRFSLLEVTVARDIPPHVHHTADEAVYVLSGTLDIDFEGRTHHAGPGTFALLPHGVPHALRCGSEPPPRVLQISSPGGWEHYLEDLIEAGASVLTDGRLDPTKINAIAARYDIRYEENQASCSTSGSSRR